MTARYYQLLSINPDKGYRYKAAALSGWAGFNHGMNEKGLSWVETLLWNKPETHKTLRPPMIVLMKALNTCSTVEKVRAYFESVPDIELGNVFYIADSDKILRNGSQGNTNLVTSSELQHLDGSSEMRQNLNATFRNIRMHKLLAKFDGRMDVDGMHSIASDHGVKCFWLYEGCPCENKVHRYDFQD